MGNIKIILLVFCASITHIYGQSYNMELLGHLPFDQECSDITGFYQDGREFAVVGLYNGSVFVDVTDPGEPFEVGRITGSNSIWRDLKYWNRHVYIGTEANDGVQVVSVDDPDTPILVNLINDFTSSHNIHVADGFLYVVGAGDHHIWIYDLSNPENPTLAGTWDEEYIHDLHVYNNKAYCAAIYSSTVYILDVSDKNSINTLTSWSYEGKAHDCAVTSDETILITGDEMTGGNIKIWDISDYDNIQLLSEYMVDPAHSVHNVYNIDNLVYCSYYADGTRVLDISDPEYPIEVGYYDTSELESLYVGNWGVYPFLPSGNIISSDIETGLYITRLTGLSIIHDPIEDVSHEAANYPIESIIRSFSGEVAAAFVFYRLLGIGNESWTSISLSDDGDGNYSGEIPQQILGTVIQYYIYATNEFYEESTFPPEGIIDPLLFTVGQLPEIYTENFEVDSGWSTDPSDDASSGIWVRDEPIPTYLGDINVQPGTDHTPDGTNCFITGNTDNPYEPGLDDVDSGTTTLISPVFDCSSYDHAMLTYWRWYTNNTGDNPNEDYWQVEISNDFGSTWSTLEMTNQSNADWTFHRVILSDYVEITEGIQLRFKASDYFNPSLVEAAVDDIAIAVFGQPVILGDVNFDISVDILDVVSIVQFIHGNIEFNAFEIQAADFDMDGIVNVLDIVAIIDFILDN